MSMYLSISKVELIQQHLHVWYDAAPGEPHDHACLYIITPRNIYVVSVLTDTFLLFAYTYCAGIAIAKWRGA